MNDVTNLTVAAALKTLRHFINPDQLAVLRENCAGEEGEWFQNKVVELATLVETMPKSMQTDGQMYKAIAYLHYWCGDCFWYITETDKSDPAQRQAFGWGDMGCGEFGYISIHNIITNGGELDLHWEPTALENIEEIKQQ